MRLPSVTPEEAQAFVFNRQSILNALRELQLDFREGPKEAVMSCFITAACLSGKRSLYVNLLDKPGVFHCFKCGEKGSFGLFVSYSTGWGEFKVVSFLRKHRPTEIETDAPAPITREFFTEADVVEGKYAYRHAYCYDRGLSEETLRRYKIGYDREDNDIIFPWYDRVGKLVAIKRRAVQTKYYRFECNESITHLLFGLHLVRPNSIVWVTEGEFDAMYLDQCFRERKLKGHGAVSIGGKYLQPKALEQLLMKTPRLIVRALDGDVDGEAAAGVIGETLAGIVPSYRMVFEDGAKDPNESSFDHIMNQALQVENLISQQTATERLRYDSFTQKKATTT
jgi:DNA primase